MSRLSLGVLVSGSGTNLQAILDAIAVGRLEADVRLVISSKEGVGALERCAAHQVPASVLLPRDYPDRAAYDEALAEALKARAVEWVALAGFMRILGGGFLRAFPGRVVNIHPALLPSFPGLHAPRQALAQGVALTGCTVHFVDEGVDTGPIIAQAAVAVAPHDDETSLHERIKKAEQRLYPAALQAIASGSVRLDDKRVLREGRVEPTALSSLEGPVSAE